MIGERIRANASGPVQKPSRTAYLFLAVVVLLIYVLGSAVASSL